MMLPKHVYEVKDRHGKTRFRFLKKGLPSHYLPAPETDGFEVRYQACFVVSTYTPGPRAKPRPTAKEKALRSWGQFKDRRLVYFIGTRGDLIKIGTTVNLYARMKKLQTGNPMRLRLLAVIDGGGRIALPSGVCGAPHERRMVQEMRSHLE